MNNARNVLQSIPVRKGFLTKSVDFNGLDIRTWEVSGNFLADQVFCIYILKHDPFQRFTPELALNQLKKL